METLKKTPLNALHRQLGGKMVPFAGWEMPVHYTGLMEEHRTVRSRCGIFDVSHMGEIEVRGPGALDAVQRLTANDAARTADGQVQYTMLCNDAGGVIDDVTLYRFSAERYVFCVNASNTAKVFDWIKHRAGSGADVADLSSRAGQIAIQGPLSLDVMRGVTDRDLGPLRFYRFLEGSIGGVTAIISRTGYTGEDGFEIYCKADEVEAVWLSVMEAGRQHGICPVGLGPRDTLRLEMGFPLYGHELDEETTPLEAGLDRFVKLDKLDFIGKAALERQKREGVRKRLIGIELLERAIPREGYSIFQGGATVGHVTSGTFSPSLERPIALGYVTSLSTYEPDEVEVEIRGKKIRGRVVKPPFYKGGSDRARKPRNNHTNLTNNGCIAG